MDEYYKVLEIRPDATREEVKAAYRDLAQVWHPDRYQNSNPRLRAKAEEKFKSISEAYHAIMAGAPSRSRPEAESATKNTHSQRSGAHENPRPPQSSPSPPPHFSTETARDNDNTNLITGAVFIVLVVVVAAIVFANHKGHSSSLLGLKNDLKVTQYQLQQEHGTSLFYVIGTMTNKSDIRYESVRVDFNLFDQAGRQVGQASDFTMSLDAKTSWAFKALVVESNVVEAKLDKVTSAW